MSGPSVLVVSQRHRPDGFGRQPGHVAFAEAEDILLAAANADVVMIDWTQRSIDIRVRRAVTGLGHRFLGDGAGRALQEHLPRRRHGASSRSIPRRRYDLVMLLGFTLWDSSLLEPLDDVCRNADRVAVWLPEAWRSEFDNPRLRFEPFHRADAHFIGMWPAVEQLSRATDRPVHYLPPAVDTVGFCPPRHPDDPAGDHPDRRPIDVLGIGRRDEILHRHLQRWAEARGRFYQYDTLTGGRVMDPTEHRRYLAGTYARTKVALTNFAKYDQPKVTQGAREIPGRFFEAMAAGTLMIGQPPATDDQIALAGRTLVAPLSTDPDQAVEQIDALVTSSAAGLRAHQVATALRCHDWAHRWVSLFEATGVPIPVGLSERVTELAALANRIDRTPGTDAPPGHARTVESMGAAMHTSHRRPVPAGLRDQRRDPAANQPDASPSPGPGGRATETSSPRPGARAGA
ncbi:MAG: glycosyltransferase [Acidimicrobiales bacterium]